MKKHVVKIVFICMALTIWGSAAYGTGKILFVDSYHEGYFWSESILKGVKTVLEGKAYLYDALKRLGLTFVPSVANFILINVERDCVSVFKDMLKLGVIVRDMSQYGLKNFIRVTVGTRKENEKFIKALKKTLA